MGINWSCGQETSLRVVNLAMAQLILNKKIVPTKTLKWFLEVSYDRIQPTFQYAIGQDNNHGVSESRAIFIIGCWGKVLNLPNADFYSISAESGLRTVLKKSFNLMAALPNILPIITD